MQLADVPLEVRCAAAIEVVWNDARLGVRERRELLATALWPLRLPHRRPTPPEAPPPSMAEVRDDVRRRFRAGASISDLAALTGQDWLTVRGWCRTRG